LPRVDATAFQLTSCAHAPGMISVVVIHIGGSINSFMAL
jgi:hypothetical protein